MSHVAPINEACPQYKWNTSHIQMSHVLNMNESCPIYEGVMSHIWMSLHLTTSYYCFCWYGIHVPLIHFGHSFYFFFFSFIFSPHSFIVSFMHRRNHCTHSFYTFVFSIFFSPHSFIVSFSSVQFNSHLFLSPIGARTLKMPVPYPPPNVGAYIRTPSHQPLLFMHSFFFLFCFLPLLLLVYGSQVPLYESCHAYESCHTYEWFMSQVRMRMSHVPHLNESHIWMSHVPHMNESCPTYEWVMSHIWMSHIPSMNTSCSAHEWVMSHT